MKVEDRSKDFLLCAGAVGHLAKLYPEGILQLQNEIE